MRAAVIGMAALLAGAAQLRADTLTAAIVDPAVAIQSALGAPAAKIAAAARELKVTTKLGDARGAFGKVSAAIVAYIDEQKLSLDPKVARIAFCPMVNKPWLQKDGPIQNPYYGTEMPTCGSFKK